MPGYIPPSYLKFLGSLHLSLLGEILNLGLAKDNVGVGGRVLVNVRLVDHEQDVLRLPDGHTGHSGHLDRVSQILFIIGIR